MKVSAEVLADRLVACRACGAGFGEPCTPKATRRARRAAASTKGAKGNISCFGRRMRRLLTFRGLGDDVVGELVRGAGGTGTKAERAEVMAILRERA